MLGYISIAIIGIGIGMMIGAYLQGEYDCKAIKHSAIAKTKLEVNGDFYGVQKIESLSRGEDS